jgi:HNH endonuclease
MAYFVYKCKKSPATHTPSNGDWDKVFNASALRAGKAIDWGALGERKGLESAKAGDLVIAVQTDSPGRIVGLAKVSGTATAANSKRRLLLTPIEQIDVPLRPLKQSNPEINSIPALQGGVIASLYPISDDDAGRLIATARFHARSRRPLHDRAILLSLGSKAIKVGVYETTKRWTSNAAAWDAARRQDLPMAIVFTDASHDSGNVYRWAILTKVELTPHGTRVAWRDVQALKGHDVTELIKVSDSVAFDRNVRRVSSTIHTPDFLQRLGPKQAVARPLKSVSASVLDAIEHDPATYESVLRRLRRHQSSFRSALLAAYGGRCAISGINADAVLEAAHIDPHAESGDNNTDNGLLLRSDLHALFDRNFLRIDPTTRVIVIDDSITSPEYRALHGQQLRPTTSGESPRKSALARRWLLAGE